MASMMRVALMVAVLVSTSACVFELADVIVDGPPQQQYELPIDVGDGGVTETLTDVPILVVLDATRIDYALTADDGSDLRFFAEDGTTALAHEVESWDESARSLVWVKLPSFAPGGQRILLRFGNPAAAAAPDPTSVWSAYVGVYHMAGDLSATVADSGPLALHGSATNVTADPDGALGQAAAFDGASSRVDFAMVSDFDIPANGQRSMEVWFRRATTDALFMTIVRARNMCGTGYALTVLPDEYANIRHDIGIGSYCRMTHMAYNLEAFGMPNLVADVDWHPVTVVMDREAQESRIYFDAAFRYTAALPATGDMAAGEAAFGIGEAGDGFMNGSIDEVRIGTRAFSDAWVTVQQLSATDALLAFGTVSAITP